MIIKTQDGDCFIRTEAIVSIELRTGNCIYAYSANGKEILLGKYDKLRAEKILGEIISCTESKFNMPKE